MDLTPKQQVSELIRQAQNILIVTGREPNNDQLASAVGLHAIITKLGKTANVVITDRLPKAASVLDTSMVAKDMSGTRDFVIHLDTARAAVDKLRYDVEGAGIAITITPHGGNFEAKDVTFGYGAYQFDLVIALGVPSLSKLDRLHEANPTIFDGLHLINIDYHRINENYGSVNLVDTAATCVAEILISIIESLGQGMIDAQVATAFLTSFMSATANFTAPATSAKALTIAAQMMSAGAKQQEIVRMLTTPNREERTQAPRPNPAAQDKVYPAAQPATLPRQAQAQPAEPAQTIQKPGVDDSGIQKTKPQPEAPEESPQVQPAVIEGNTQDQSDGSKKNSKIAPAQKPAQNQTNQASRSDHSRAASTPTQANSAAPSAILSPLSA